MMTKQQYILLLVLVVALFVGCTGFIYGVHSRQSAFVTTQFEDVLTRLERQDDRILSYANNLMSKQLVVEKLSTQGTTAQLAQQRMFYEDVRKELHIIVREVISQGYDASGKKPLPKQQSP